MNENQERITDDKDVQMYSITNHYKLDFGIVK